MEKISACKGQACVYVLYLCVERILIFMFKWPFKPYAKNAAKKYLTEYLLTIMDLGY